MKVKHIMFIAISIIAILLLCITNVQAGGYSTNITEWTFGEPQLPTKVSELAGLVIAFLRNLSIIVTVIVLVILGVKYMLGSVEEKADYKKDFPNIIIGVVMITAVFSIISVVFSAVEGLI